MKGLLDALSRLDARERRQLIVFGWALCACVIYILFPLLLDSSAPLNTLFECNRRPVETRVIPSLLMATLFILFVLYRAPPTGGDPFEEPRFTLSTHLAPAGLALGTVVLVIGTMLVTGYLTGAHKFVGSTASPAVATAAMPDLHAVFELAKGTPGKALAPTAGALLLWACMYAITVITALVALWFAAGVFVNCRAKKHRTLVSWWFAVPAVAAAAMFTFLGRSDQMASFGGLVGSVMLCGAWQRVIGAEAQRLAQLSDALNVVGMAVPIAVVFGACLLLEVLKREHTDKETPIGVVKDIARASATLDFLLYVGAAALVAGTLQVSALYAMTLAHVPTVADVKVKRDICRISTSDPAPGFSKVCEELPEQFKAADRAADLRQFAKSVTLGFGIAFSVLLGVIYLAAATPLTAYARRLVLPTVGGDELAAQARLVKLGIESDLLGKLGRLATTLSPLAAGLISNLIGAGA